MKLIAIPLILVAIALGLMTTPTAHKLIFQDILPWIHPLFIGFSPQTLTDEERAAAFKYEDLPTLTGHVSIVTGANAGVGYWTVYHLAKKGSAVVMACRNRQKCKDAATNIRKELPNAELHPLILDTSSLKSVTAFTQEIRQKFKRLDHVVLNAGIDYVSEEDPLSADGLSLMFATNHLGHFKIFQDISDIMESTASTYGVSTLVVVSSTAHFASSAPPNTFEEVTSNTITYPQSKLCNVLFANEVADRMKAKGVNVLANSLNPGFVDTKILDRRGDNWEEHSPYKAFFYKWSIKWLRESMSWSPEEGALTQVFAAASTAVTDGKISGKYFQPIAQEIPPYPALATKENQAKLWEFSEQVIRKFGPSD